MTQKPAPEVTRVNKNKEGKEMKYIVIDVRPNDEFTKEFDKADEAIKFADDGNPIKTYK